MKLVKTKDKQDYINWLEGSFKKLQEIDEDVTKLGGYPDWLDDLRIQKYSIRTALNKI